jgi:hypothetical protein
MARHHFFDWHPKGSAPSQPPHMRFRLLATILLIAACSALLVRVSYLTDSSKYLAFSLLVAALLLGIGLWMIFTRRLIFSKITAFASLLLFEAVIFAHSPLLNLSPVTPQLIALIFGNFVFLILISQIND